MHGQVVQPAAAPKFSHIPAKQTSSEAQPLSQPPQFRGSPETATQELTHVVVLAGHDETQVPAAHRGGKKQARPTIPQLAGSVATSTQVLGLNIGVTRVSPGRHTHELATQYSSFAHVTPTPPQFCGSREVSRQRLALGTSGAAHTHELAMQLADGSHTLPQPPQF